MTLVEMPVRYGVRRAECEGLVFYVMPIKGEMVFAVLQSAKALPFYVDEEAVSLYRTTASTF